MKRRSYKVSLAGIGALAWAMLGSGVAAPAEEAKASVWKAVSPTATLFLAGSVHLLRQRDYPLPPAYDAAYRESEELLFEIDLGAVVDEEGKRRIAQAGRLPAGESLRDHVGEETYEMVQEYLDMRGLKGAAFDSFKPGMLAVTIASFEHMRKGAMPQFGVDAVFYNRAVEDGKPVSGLETSEFQLALFSALSPAKQEAMLRETIESLDDTEETRKQIMRAWRNGDVELLGELLSEEVTMDKDIGEIFLLKRNRDWMPRIVEFLEGEHNAMVIVGAGHLVGKGSVVRLLRKKGYRVVQMKYNPDSVSTPKPVVTP